MLILADVIEAICGLRPEWGAQAITAAVIDSRQATSGGLFVALPGEHVDGHEFIKDAFANGAMLCLAQRLPPGEVNILDLRPAGKEHLLPDLKKRLESEPTLPLCLLVEDSLSSLQQMARYWRRKHIQIRQPEVDHRAKQGKEQLSPEREHPTGREHLRVIGITGSVGKSTTKELVAEVLRQRYRTLKNPGNLNNEIGLPLTLLSLDESYQRAVLEMGFYVPGEIKFLCEIALPHVGVVTNIGTVHAERAGSQEAIARGKAELVEALPPSPEGLAILNYDDPWVRKMAEQTQARVFFYGLDPRADLWADNIESLGLDGIRFRLHYRNEVLNLRVPLIGRHSVHTVLRATAVGLLEGLTWQEIVDGLRSRGAQLRLVAVRSESGALILDDTYNAAPESTLAALNLLDELEAGIEGTQAAQQSARESHKNGQAQHGRKLAILGDMLELGPYAQRGHEMVGVRAADVVDELVTVGELARIIAQAAQRAGLEPSAIIPLENCQQAIEYIQPRLKENDVLLVKGSHGMHMEQIVAALEERRS